MKQIKKFIIYFPVILVSLQVLMNLWALIDRPAYDAAGFYLNTFIGTNIFFSVFLVCFTWLWPFCKVSRWAAIAELAFAVNYFFVRQDNLYNILFQVIVGVVALILTYKHFTAKFPLCMISLFSRFIGWVVLTGSCSKALDKWESETKHIVKTTYHNAINSIHSS
jgi:hypothetical protein